MAQNLLTQRRITPPWFYLVLTGIWLALDFALKSWSLANLSSETMRPFIPGVLSLPLSFNEGAAWGLFSGSTLPLSIFRIVVALAILIYVFRTRPEPFVGLPLSLISAGALGNGLESLLRGRVTDMLYSHQLSALTQALGQGTFPIFNLADVWVVTGVLLLLLGNVLRRDRNTARERLDA
jgi:signal peptidase II